MTVFDTHRHEHIALHRTPHATRDTPVIFACLTVQLAEEEEEKEWKRRRGGGAYLIESVEGLIFHCSLEAKRIMSDNVLQLAERRSHGGREEKRLPAWIDR